MKTRILNFIQGFSLKFEDRKRHFSSKFDQKLTSPWKGPFGTFAKPFVLWDLGDDSGLQAILTLFKTFFIFFHIFFFVVDTNVSLAQVKRTILKIDNFFLFFFVAVLISKCILFPQEKSHLLKKWSFFVQASMVNSNGKPYLRIKIRL